MIIYLKRLIRLDDNSMIGVRILTFKLETDFLLPSGTEVVVNDLGFFIGKYVFVDGNLFAYETDSMSCESRLERDKEVEKQLKRGWLLTRSLTEID